MTFVAVAICTLTHVFPRLNLSNEVPVIVASSPVSIKERFIQVYTKNDDSDLPNGVPKLIRCGQML